MSAAEAVAAAGTKNDAPVQCVLFDLSGVLADFRGAEALGELLGGIPAEDVWPRWLASSWMRRFDVGGCTPQEFSAGIVDEWGLGIAPEELLQSFAGWMVGPYPGAEELVSRTRERVCVGCMSNMNPLHWAQIERWRLASGFDHRFISCEIGLLKPDREIYEHAAASLATNPSRVLFLDDNMINVEGAMAAGFRSRRVQGVAAAERVLRDSGVLP